MCILHTSSFEGVYPYWWLIEIPHWFKVTYFTKMLGSLTKRGEKNSHQFVSSIPTSREGHVFTGVCLSTIGLMNTASVLCLIMARSLCILLECFLIHSDFTQLNLSVSSPCVFEFESLLSYMCSADLPFFLERWQGTRGGVAASGGEEEKGKTL